VFEERPGVTRVILPTEVANAVIKAVETIPNKVVAHGLETPAPLSPFGYPLKVTRVEEDIDSDYQGSLLPSRAYHDDAGLDLYVSQKTTVYAGEYKDVPCGIAVELPYWAWGLVIGRSSSMRKRGLQVQSSVMDAGYRGPQYVLVYNLSGATRVLMPGERLGQLIIMHNHTRSVDPRMVDELSQSARGINGFGSSGV